MAARSPRTPKSLCDVSVRAEGIGKAAWQLEDTQQDRLVRNYPMDPEAREAYFELAHAETNYRWALVLMIALTCFETPTWCTADEPNLNFVYRTPESLCTIEGVDQSKVLLSNLPYIPLGLGFILEVYIIFLIARKFLLEWGLQVTYFDPIGVTYISKRMIYIGLVMVCLEMVDILFFVLYRPSFRFAVFPRTCYLAMLPAARSLMSCIISVLGQVASIGVFLVGAIFFFAWIALTIFHDLQHENEGFESLSAAVYTMFRAGTTEDFLECFVPSYTKFRITGILWLFFLTTVQVLMLSLVLDSLVSAYTEFSERQQEDTIAEKMKGMLAAYDTLSQATGEGQNLSKITFLDFVREFSRSPRTRPIRVRTANIIFHAADQDGEGTLTKEEFCDICGVMQYDFWTTPKYSFVYEHFKTTWNSRHFTKLREAVTSGNFDDLMNLVLMVNFVLVISETVYDLHPTWGDEPSFMGVLELTFSFIYVGEVLIKLTVWSWGFYWSFPSNKFDFFTTWALLGSSILQEVVGAEGSVSGDVKRYMNMLRLLRLLRVMKQLKRLKTVQFMISTVSKLLTASTDMMTFLGIVLYFFSTLSVQLWGGLLWEGRKELHGSPYAESKYYVLNFNDFPMALGVWVVSLLAEYVSLFPDAISRCSAYPSTWYIFLIFYLFSVCIVFELVQAFTIEVFLDLYGKRNEEEFRFAALDSLVEEFDEMDLALFSRPLCDETAQQKAIEEMHELLGESGSESSDAAEGHSRDGQGQHGS